MFDWNDEELTNIIWGEAEEGGDHIVPHPDANQEKHSDVLRNHVKNERNKECVDLKPKELTKFILQNTSHGIKAESCSPDGNALSKTQYSLDVVPDPILTLDEKVAHDSEGTETYNKVSDISRNVPTSEVETAALDTASEIFQSPLEESEQSDFVDYGWANVGSFEDLDRIFSNEDPILGHASLGIAEDLWTSCRDGTGSSDKSIFLKDDPPSLGISPLRNKLEQFDAEADFLSDENQSLTPCYFSLAPQDRNWLNENSGSSDGENILSKDKTALETGQSDCLGSFTDNTLSVAETNESMDKGNLQKKLLKNRKRVKEDSDFRGLEQGSIGHQNRYIQSHSPYAPAVLPPSLSLGFTQQMPREVPEPSQLKYMSSPLTPIVNGNVANAFASLPYLSPFHSMGVGLQPTITSSYEVSHRPHEVPCRPLSMTPQEKIEKLRRKQQMKAMLAIQKQERQFGSGESSMKYSALERENSEAGQNLPTFDLNSPMQQDLTNKAGMVLDENSAADRILYQLQDTISKLDMNTRLSMRDSLYRLANSASQRRYACGTSSVHLDSRNEANTKEESNVHIRFPEACNVETQTNPVDRTMAHLLFYRPMEIPGKLAEIKATSSFCFHDSLDSPLSKAKGLPYEIQSTSSGSSPADYFVQKSTSKKNYYHDNKPEVSALFPQVGNLKKSSRMEPSEITSDK